MPLTSIHRARRPRLDAATVSYLFTLALIAVPGVAVLKFLAIVATLIFGTLRKDFATRGVVIGYLALISLMLGYLIATGRHVSPVDRDGHLIRIFSFYAVFACLTYARHGFSTQWALDKVCVSATTIMAALKVGILCTVVVFGYSLDDAMNVFGFESVTAGIGESLFRLQFPSDFVVLFLLAIYVGGRSRATDLLFIASLGVVVFLSFSRFIFLCFFVGIAIRYIWMRRADLITLISAALVLGALVAFSGVLIDRFVGEGSEDSDSVRIEQIEKLVDEIELHPLFGAGLGASVPGFLRSETIPYSYEVQWHATVMQLGLVGTGLLLLNVLLAVFWGIRMSRSRLCLAILVAMWVAAGFTNPFITSLGSAVGLSLARRRARLVEPQGTRRWRLASTASRRP